MIGRFLVSAILIGLLGAEDEVGNGRRAVPLWSAAVSAAAEGLRHPQEVHLANVRQLTFGGENAEAYFSFDGQKLILQSTRDKFQADQIYTMNLDGSGVQLVSPGLGRCTCSYFFPGGDRILFASTHFYDPAPPPPPDYSQGYVWALYDTYDLYTACPDGSDLRRLTTAWGYDAEATVGPDDRIVFTSMRNGDLDLYVMDADGTNVRQVTHTLGYDGGAFFSPDGKKICFRAFHPQTDEEIADYKRLLARGLIRPTSLDLYVMDADGANLRQVTDHGAANFCPFFTPDGQRLIFASNLHEPDGHNFDLYLVNLDGTALEHVTFDPTFDAFPMFSPDGTKLVWASNRNAKVRGETNIFIADWRE